MRGNRLRKPAARLQGARALEQLRALIAERYDSLSPRLQQVGRYALDHPIDLAMESVTTVARGAGVQPSTIVRFAQAFGFAGFGDLQRVFRNDVAAGSSSYPERLRAVEVHAEPAPSAPPVGSLARFTAAQALSIEHLRQSIDETLLDDAIQILLRARQIYVIGDGHDRVVAEYLRYALPQADRLAYLLVAGDGTAERLVRLITPRDAVIAVCSAPHSDATASLGRAAAKQGVPLVVLSDGPVNPLAKSATIDFHIKDAAFRTLPSVTASLSLATFLAASLMSETTLRSAAE